MLAFIICIIYKKVGNMYACMHVRMSACVRIYVCMYVYIVQQVKRHLNHMRMFWLEMKIKNKFNLFYKQRYTCKVLTFPMVHKNKVQKSTFVCRFPTVYNSNTNLHFQLKLRNGDVYIVY